MKPLHPELYFRFQRKVCTGLLERSNVKVACHEEFPEQIFGYLIYEPMSEATIVHYAYVKQVYRKMGILKKLLEDLKAPFIYTHQTKSADAVAKKFGAHYYPQLVFHVDSRNETDQPV